MHCVLGSFCNLTLRLYTNKKLSLLLVTMKSLAAATRIMPLIKKDKPKKNEDQIVPPRLNHFEERKPAVIKSIPCILSSIVITGSLSRLRAWPFPNAYEEDLDKISQTAWRRGPFSFDPRKKGDSHAYSSRKEGSKSHWASAWFPS